jgi:hypothetical protein
MLLTPKFIFYFRDTNYQTLPQAMLIGCHENDQKTNSVSAPKPGCYPMLNPCPTSTSWAWVKTNTPFFGGV